VFAAIDRFLRGKSMVWITACSGISAFALALVDLLTGYELAFSIFYLAPVAIAAWYGGLARGMVVSALSALAWLMADTTAGNPYSSMIIPLWNTAVRFGFFIVTARLLASLKTHLAREQDLARQDGLTGIMNGRAFDEAAQPMLELAARHGHPTAVGYVDLDDFKVVNDTRGHAEGDRILRAVAELLRREFRGSDLVCRLGGDEFAVLLPETDLAGARTVFEKVHRELVREMRERAWPIGFSIGVAVFAASRSVDRAIRVADQIMYRAKSSGKNRVLLEEFGAAPNG
jgi:diguanylate cyclase (GGDEF)-like protein